MKGGMHCIASLNLRIWGSRIYEPEITTEALLEKVDPGSPDAHNMLG